MNENARLDPAASPTLSAEQCRPVDMQLDRKDGLTIHWADEQVSHYSLVFLRKNCPCASCRTEREQAKPASSGRSLTILPPDIGRATEFVNAKRVGHYALQIDWADGHQTGIYDFRYLRQLSARPNNPAGDTDIDR